jgi:predicted Zn-dependent protease
MNGPGKPWKLLAAGVGILILASRLLAGDTNNVGGTNRDDISGGLLRIQEQIHATQFAIDHALNILSEGKQLAASQVANEQYRQAAMAASASNAAAMTQRLEALEQTLVQEHHDDSRTQKLALMMVGVFGLIGLGILVLMIYYQWRAFFQLAEIATQQQSDAANRNGVHQLAAPGRAAVEASAAQLLSAVGRLEQRIQELESGQKLLPQTPAPATGDSLGEGQQLLETNAPQQALEYFDRLLAAQPNRADAIVKRSAALEKLGRDDEALAGYNRAIVADPTLTIAHLHKGGLLNRLRRYDEALNCYEQALLGQDKKARA